MLVFSSISTKSTFAPQCKAQVADATNVFGTVHRVFPFLKFNAKQDKCKAADALLTATANFEFTNLDIFFSKS